MEKGFTLTTGRTHNNLSFLDISPLKDIFTAKFVLSSLDFEG